MTVQQGGDVASGRWVTQSNKLSGDHGIVLLQLRITFLNRSCDPRVLRSQY